VHKSSYSIYWLLVIILIGATLIISNQPNQTEIHKETCKYQLASWDSTSLSTPSSNIWNIKYVNGYYYILCQDGWWRSSDLTIWTTLTGISGTADGTVVYYSGAYILSAGSTIFRSIDGRSFTSVYTTTAESVQTMIEYNGYLYGFTYNQGKILRSSNGEDWSEVAVTGYTSSYGFLKDSATTYNGNIFVCQYTGQLYSSANGVDWTEVYTYTSGAYSIRSICNYGSCVYAFGATVVHWSDSNGENWQTQALNVDSNTYLITPIATDGGVYLAAGRATGTSYLNAKVYEYNENEKNLTCIAEFDAEHCGGLVSDSEGLVAVTDYGDIFRLTNSESSTADASTSNNTAETNTPNNSGNIFIIINENSAITAAFIGGIFVIIAACIQRNKNS
jgi:hypothetical protein